MGHKTPSRLGAVCEIVHEGHEGALRDILPAFADTWTSGTKTFVTFVDNPQAAGSGGSEAIRRPFNLQAFSTGTDAGPQLHQL